MPYATAPFGSLDQEDAAQASTGAGPYASDPYASSPFGGGSESTQGGGTPPPQVFEFFASGHFATQFGLHGTAYVASSLQATQFGEHTTGSLDAAEHQGTAFGEHSGSLVYLADDALATQYGLAFSPYPRELQAQQTAPSTIFGSLSGFVLQGPSITTSLIIADALSVSSTEFGRHESELLFEGETLGVSSTSFGQHAGIQALLAEESQDANFGLHATGQSFQVGTSAATQYGLPVARAGYSASESMRTRFGSHAFGQPNAYDVFMQTPRTRFERHASALYAGGIFIAEGVTQTQAGEHEVLPAVFAIHQGPATQFGRGLIQRTPAC